MKQLLLLILLVCAQHGYAQKKIYEYTDDEMDSLTSTRIPAKVYSVRLEYHEEKGHSTGKNARLSLAQDGRYLFEIYTTTHSGWCGNITADYWSFGTFSERDSLIELNDKKRNKTFTLTKGETYLIPASDFVIQNKLEPDKVLDYITPYDLGLD